MNNKVLGLLLGLYFVFYFIYWVLLVSANFAHFNIFFSQEIVDNYYFYYSNFTHTYAVVCLLGLYLGVKSSELWGGFKSTFGRALLLFGIGLLFQQLGQIVIAIYEVVLGIHNPYPSFAEVFFAGSIPIYIAAAYYLGKSYGIETYLSLKNKNFIAVVILGAILTFISYIKFTYSTETTFNELPTFLAENDIDYILLEIIYPIGQSIFLALVVLDLLLLRNINKSFVYLGVMLFMFALLLQFSADTIYLYYDEIFSDILYISSYTLLSFGLLYFNRLPKFSKNNGTQQ